MAAIIYICIGILFFFAVGSLVLPDGEEEYYTISTPVYDKFYNNKRWKRVVVRLTQIVLWPLYIIGIILFVIAATIKVFFKLLIK